MAKHPEIDGIPHEFYKILDILFKENRTNNNSFDVVGFLTKLYEDIEQFGMVKNCKLSMAWMCPIFKKGDKSLIGNYRPVTLIRGQIYCCVIGMRNYPIFFNVQKYPGDSEICGRRLLSIFGCFGLSPGYA
jgi:hypothetical protein